MNRSYSKIRHIQEANLKLEKRLIKEEDELEDEGSVEDKGSAEDEMEIGGNKFSEVIRMDQEFDEDPVYKKYEKQYIRKKILNTISEKLGFDPSDMDEEETDAMVEMFSVMMDLSKDGMESRLTPHNIMKHKDGVITMVQSIKEMADEDGETELSQKITDFIDKLNEL
jgi:hypothetical protein